MTLQFDVSLSSDICFLPDSYLVRIVSRQFKGLKKEKNDAVTFDNRCTSNRNTQENSLYFYFH